MGSGRRSSDFVFVISSRTDADEEQLTGCDAEVFMYREHCMDFSCSMVDPWSKYLVSRVDIENQHIPSFN